MRVNLCDVCGRNIEDGFKRGLQRVEVSDLKEVFCVVSG